MTEAKALVDLRVADGRALLTLNDPERRNAIGLPLAAEVVGAVAAAAADENVRCLIVTGAGSAFCAGANLGDLRADEAALRAIYRAFTAVREFPLPTVAAVNGPAVGAGVNLALACDVRLAAESARFDTRFLRLGLHPGGGHLWSLRRVVGDQGVAALTLLGQPVDGATAERVGLAWRCVPDARLLDTARELTEYVATAPRTLVTRMTRSARAADTHLDQQAALEQELVAQVWSARQEFFQPRIVR